MSIKEQELHAYVDGQLDPARVAEIEAHLAANSQDLMRVEAFRKQNQICMPSLIQPWMSHCPARCSVGIAPARNGNAMRRWLAPWRWVWCWVLGCAE